MIEAGQLYQDLRNKKRKVVVLAKPFKGEALLCKVFSGALNRPVGRPIRIPMEVLCDPTQYRALMGISEHLQGSP